MSFGEARHMVMKTMSDGPKGDNITRMVNYFPFGD
jgi:hypothetical protein